MNYEEKYNNLVAAIKQLQESNPSDEGIQNWVEDNVPELCESEDERIRNLIYCLIRDRSDNGKLLEHNGISVDKALAWLEKQGNDSYLQEKINAFTAAHKGEDPEEIIAACRGYEKQDEQKPAWSEEDEVGLSDALWAIEQARTIAKDENDMGNLWYAERWLNSLKERVQPTAWKPGSDQFGALQWAIEQAEQESLYVTHQILASLMGDLKKLKEE